MSELWPRIEALLGRVQKPARYIGCEDGAVTPQHGPGKVSWLLAYPDAYEVGLPNQGLQILYEILNERADAVAERTYAPWTDLVVLVAPARRAAVLRRHPPRGRRLRPARLQPLVRARLHERARDARPRRRADPLGRSQPEHPLVVVGGHSAFNPEPLADFVDLVVLGDGEEVVGEITASSGRGSADGRADRVSRAAPARAGAGGVRPGAVRRRRRRGRGDATLPRRPARPSTSARSPTSAPGRTRSTSWCR